MLWKPHLLCNKNDKLQYEPDLDRLARFGNLEKRVRQIQVLGNSMSTDFCLHTAIYIKICTIHKTHWINIWVYFEIMESF